ncbi:signal peptidase I [halophilic archaeon]|nr:signal peptidase I [halophilic archaeon]
MSGSGPSSSLRRLSESVDAKRIARAGALALLCAGVLLTAVVAFPQVVGASESYVVLSGSMSPVIHAGDVVVVRDVPAESIEKGDVITFERASDARPERTTHRVVAVNHRGGEPVFRTKGDANEDPDARPVPADDLVGRVWFTLPYVGHFLLFAQSKLGLVSLVIVPSALLVVSEAYSLARAAFGDAGNDATETAEGNP